MTVLMGMTSKLVLLFLLVAFAPQARADSELPEAYPEIAYGVRTWSACHLNNIVALSPTRHSDEEVVDRAFSACMVSEYKIKKLWIHKLGRIPREEFDGMRDRWRTERVALVHEMRGTTPQTNPLFAVERCARAQLPDGAQSGQPSLTIVNAAFAACGPDLAEARERISATFGPANADAYTDASREVVQQRLIALVDARHQAS